MVTRRHPLAQVEPALDRFREAHFWIHMLEQHYHHADPFRWHLNAFLKCIKEIPQLIQMALQNRRGFSTWFREHRRALASHQLLRHLGEKRDFVVHRGMLVPDSQGSIGLTEGRGFKLGLTFPVHPLEDSVHAMHRYLQYVLEHKDVLGLLREDDDSLPCIHREWKIEGLDEEIVESSAQAWLRTGETINAVVSWMGVDPEELSLNCRHSAQRVQFKLFDRAELKKQLQAMRRESRARRSRKKPEVAQ